MSSEKDIFTEFSRGNLNGFYRECYPGFVLFARKMLGYQDSSLAEDMVQNAVVKAWENRNRLHDHNSFKSFIYVTIKNQIINVFRKRTISDKYRRQLEDSELGWDHAMIDQEAVTLLYNVARSLPPNLKEVYRQSFLENKRVYEVSQILNIPERTVKKYRADILTFFRDRLEVIYLLVCILSQIRD